jgi:hypothetical protein
MKKYFLVTILAFTSFFLFGCMGTNTIKLQYNTKEAELLKRVKQLVIQDNFTIESDEQFSFTTAWKKTTKEEDNIPDGTIQAQFIVSVSPAKSGSELLFTVWKRSSLDSQDPSAPSYTDVGIILNDLLLKRWNEKLKVLQEEFKK